ncbi:MAG: LysR family transcriptional regulator [Lachnospiraceae bacterium]|nr:LysR family transcriptional regulator [Lachnospiraceae bacterium]
MDLRALTIFIEVAELKSFTKAGEKLGYSQPTVSFQIKQLEQELGVQLFDRIGHTVSLTDAGKDALNYAQRICRMSQEMVQEVSERSVPKGEMRLAMADSLCTPLIAGEFASFRKACPSVSLKVMTAGTDGLFRMLDHNEADLVCTLDSHIYDTAYVIADEEKIDAHFVACAGHPLAGKDSVEIHELLAEPFILTEKGMSYRRLLDEELAKRSMEIHPVLEMGGADLICRLVVEGVGLSFLPDYVTERAVQEGRIVRLPVRDIQVELWKQVLYRRDKWVTLPMQALMEHMDFNKI